MAVVIKHVKTTDGVEKSMYFKRFNKFNIEWVDDAKDAKRYKDDFAAGKDLKTLRQASRGAFYTENV